MESLWHDCMEACLHVSVLCSGPENRRSSSRRLQSGSRSGRKGSRGRNAYAKLGGSLRRPSEACVSQPLRLFRAHRDNRAGGALACRRALLASGASPGLLDAPCSQAILRPRCHLWPVRDGMISRLDSPELPNFLVINIWGSAKRRGPSPLPKKTCAPPLARPLFLPL